jgi:hypothetical protein
MSELLSACTALTTREDYWQSPDLVLNELEEILTAQAMLAAAFSQRLRAAMSMDATTDVAGRSTRGWLIEEMRLFPGDAKRRIAAAYAAAELPAVLAAEAAGDIHPDHVAVIGATVRALPADWKDTGEAILLDAARTLDHPRFTQALEYLKLASGADESRDAAEQRRFGSRYLVTSPTIGGMIHLDAMLDPLAGRTLLTALAPLADKAGPDDDRTATQRNADALTELAQRALDSDTLPDHNGSRPQLVVTIDYDTLVGAITGNDATASLTGATIPLTAATARQIACDAHVIPAVLRGRSTLLDLGDKTRVWNTGQRRAAHLRDGGCVFTGCTAGPTHTDLHHIHHWADGGKTDLDNAATLCRYHHHLVHHTRWDIQRSPTGDWIVVKT